MSALSPPPVEVAGDELAYNLHPGQLRVMDSEARFVAAIAGSQSGKTEVGPLWLHREIQTKGPGDYFVVTPSFPLLELKALPKFRQLFEERLRLGHYTAGPSRRFRFTPDGARRTFGSNQTEPTVVFFGYAEDPESLESATAKAAWLDEGGQKRFRLGSWEAIQRRLAIHRGRALITTTPYDLGWLKQQVYDRWQSGDRDYEVIQFASTENPAFPVEEYERARATLPRWKFDMFYRGQFSRPAGMIYDCFSDANKCPRFAIPPDWPRHLGLDFGGVNTAGIFLAEEPHSTPTRYYIYREYLAGGRTARGHAEALLHGEATRPTYVVGGSKSEGQWRDEFRAGSLPVREPPVSDVEVGIDRVYGAISTGRLVVFADCTALLEEIGSYSRQVDEAGNPLPGIADKESYHRLDALRYIVSWLCRSAYSGPPKINPPRMEHRNPVHTKYRSAFQ